MFLHEAQSVLYRGRFHLIVQSFSQKIMFMWIMFDFISTTLFLLVACVFSWESSSKHLSWLVWIDSWLSGIQTLTFNHFNPNLTLKDRTLCTESQSAVSVLTWSVPRHKQHKNYPCLHGFVEEEIRRERTGAVLSSAAERRDSRTFARSCAHTLNLLAL